MNTTTHPNADNHGIINHGLLNHKLPQTQVAYVLVFLAVPLVLAALACVDFIQGQADQMLKNLWVYTILAVPSLFAGISYWLLVQTCGHKKASPLTMLSYTVIAVLSLSIAISTQKLIFAPIPHLSPGQQFFPAFEHAPLFIWFLFAFIATFAMCALLSKTPHKRYGKLGGGILLLTTAALFSPIKSMTQNYMGYCGDKNCVNAGQKLNDDDKINYAIGILLDQQRITTQAQDADLARHHYPDVASFLAKNPSCCQISQQRKTDEPYGLNTSALEFRFSGHFNTYVHLTYKQSMHEDAPTVFRSIALSNCGQEFLKLYSF